MIRRPLITVARRGARWVCSRPLPAIWVRTPCRAGPALDCVSPRCLASHTNVARNSRSSAWSTLYAPVVPEHVGLVPKETIATIVLVPETKIGPPESPKQAPPVLALLENLAAVPFPAPRTPLRLTSRS